MLNCVCVCVSCNYTDVIISANNSIFPANARKLALVVEAWDSNTKFHCCTVLLAAKPANLWMSCPQDVVKPCTALRCLKLTPVMAAAAFDWL